MAVQRQKIHAVVSSGPNSARPASAVVATYGSATGRAAADVAGTIRGRSSSTGRKSCRLRLRVSTLRLPGCCECCLVCIPLAPLDGTGPTAYDGWHASAWASRRVYAGSVYATDALPPANAAEWSTLVLTLVSHLTSN
jgi:hypothetical protein